MNLIKTKRQQGITGNTSGGSALQALLQESELKGPLANIGFI